MSQKRLSQKTRTLLAMILLLMPLTACSSTITYPSLLHPGPSKFQQNNALHFDPYPLNDVGPEIVGGRPREFQKPMDATRRARQYQPPGTWRTAPRY